MARFLRAQPPPPKYGLPQWVRFPAPVVKLASLQVKALDRARRATTVKYGGLQLAPAAPPVDPIPRTAFFVAPPRLDWRAGIAKYGLPQWLVMPPDIEARNPFIVGPVVPLPPARQRPLYGLPLWAQFPAVSASPAAASPLVSRRVATRPRPPQRALYGLPRWLIVPPQPIRSLRYEVLLPRRPAQRAFPPARPRYGLPRWVLFSLPPIVNYSYRVLLAPRPPLRRTPFVHPLYGPPPIVGVSVVVGECRIVRGGGFVVRRAQG